MIIPFICVFLRCCGADKEFIHNDFTLNVEQAAERLKCNTSAVLHNLLKTSEEVIWVFDCQILSLENLKHGCFKLKGLNLKKWQTLKKDETPSQGRAIEMGYSNANSNPAGHWKRDAMKYNTYI